MYTGFSFTGSTFVFPSGSAAPQLRKEMCPLDLFYRIKFPITRVPLFEEPRYVHNHVLPMQLAFVFYAVLLMLCFLCYSLPSPSAQNWVLVSINPGRMLAARARRQYYVNFFFLPVILSYPFRLYGAFRFIDPNQFAILTRAARRRLPKSFPTADWSGRQHLQWVIKHLTGKDALPSQISCLTKMYGVAQGFYPKPRYTGSTRTATREGSSASQLHLVDKVIGRALSCFNLIVQGNAGCSKTTMYLGLALQFKCAVIVPSNELMEDIEKRAFDLGIDILVSTQHVCFDLDLSDYVLLVDEIWMLPEYHVRAIANLSSRVIGFGDPYQTHDLGFGQLFQSRFQQQVDEEFVELPVSFTVPQDIITLAKSLGLIPHHWSSLSSIETSLYRLRNLAELKMPTISFARECKVGFRSSIGNEYTVVTAQGARFYSVAHHICDRDLGILSPSGTFSTGDNLKPLLWTSLSRHSRLCVLDWSNSAYITFRVAPPPICNDDSVVKYLLDGDPQGVFITSTHTTLPACQESSLLSPPPSAPSGATSASIPPGLTWPPPPPPTESRQPSPPPAWVAITLPLPPSSSGRSSPAFA